MVWVLTCWPSMHACCFYVENWHTRTHEHRKQKQKHTNSISVGDIKIFSMHRHVVIYVHRSMHLFIVRSMHISLIDMLESINDGYIEICTLNNGKPHSVRHHASLLLFYPRFDCLCFGEPSDINLCIFVWALDGIWLEYQRYSYRLMGMRCTWQNIAITHWTYCNIYFTYRITIAHSHC